MVGPQPTEDDILLDLIKTNRRTEGETLTKKQYKEHGEHNPWNAVNRFNTWNEAKQTAGVYKDNPDTTRISREDIVDDMAEIYEEKGKLDVQTYKEHGQYSISTVYNKFDSFNQPRHQAYRQ